MFLSNFTRSAICIAALTIGYGTADAALGEQRYVAFPAEGIELPQPPGFERATGYKGLTNAALGASVMVTVVPGPFAQVSKGMTAEGLKSGGMKLIEKSEVTIANKQSLLLNVTQTAEGTEVGKWLAVFGDRTTTMIVGVYPLASKDSLSEQVKAIVLGARAIERRPPAPGKSVDFKLGSSQKLRLATEANKMLIYTRDGTIPVKSPADPLFVAGKSVAPIRSANLKEFALQRLKQTAETQIESVESNAESTIDGLDGFQAIALAKDQKTGTPLVVYQLMLFAGDHGYYLMQGIVGREAREEFLPEFQSMSKSFRRQAAARQDAERRPFPDLEEHRKRFEARIPAEQSRKPGPPGDANQRSQELPAAKPVASTLPAPKRALPTYRYRADDVQSTDAIGSKDDQAESFADRAPEGGLLVGAQIVTGKRFGNSVSAIEPIFLIADQYKSQGLHGLPQGESHVLLAPAGHAVGGVQIRSGLVMDAIRLVYMPVKGAQLDDKHAEYSEWIGGKGGNQKEISGAGSLIVGMGGTLRDDEMRTVQLDFVNRKNAHVANQRPASAVRNDPATMRTWKSASGKFTVKARLESFDGTQAVLIAETGKKITVEADKLSDADRAFLKELQIARADTGAKSKSE